MCITLCLTHYNNNLRFKAINYQRINIQTIVIYCCYQSVIQLSYYIGESKINTCFHVDVIFTVVCSGSLPVATTTPLSDCFLLSITATATAGKLFRLCDRTCLLPPPPPLLPDNLMLLLIISKKKKKWKLIIIITTTIETTPIISDYVERRERVH